MEFVELTKEEFTRVQNKMVGNSFYQTVEWAEFKNINDWNYCYVGVKSNNVIVGATMLLSKKFLFGKQMFYAPRGFLIDYNNCELLKFFTIGLKKYIRNKGGFLVKIDPLIEYKHHNNEGVVIDDGFSNESIYNALTKFGYKHKGFTVGYSSEAQFRWSYYLDINRTMVDLMANMDQRCRRCIRKSMKYPLIMVDVNNKNMDDFKRIMESTANRQGHYDRSKNYYLSLKEKLGKRCKMVIVYLDKGKYLADFKDDKLYEVILKDGRDLIPISAGVFIFDKHKTNYVYGGTDAQYMSLMAQYKMQFEMIVLSMEKKLDIYDFGGISGNFKKGTPNYGVYEFKRGFGGYVVEYIGEFDLITNYFIYYIFKLSYNFYRFLKKVKVKLSNLVGLH